MQGMGGGLCDLLSPPQEACSEYGQSLRFSAGNGGKA